MEQVTVKIKLSGITLLLLLLLLLLLFNLAACSKQQMFNTAMDFQRSSANLSLQSILLESGRIYYLENDNPNNSDTSLILLHGFTGDKDNWNLFSSELHGDYRIISLDLLGHGQNSIDLNFDYSISNQAKMLHEFIVAKKINSIHLAGNSMGGAVAIRYYGRYPDNIKTLTLIDALGTKDSKKDRDRLIAKYQNNPLLDICDSEKYHKMLNIGMFKPRYVPDIFMDHLVTIKCSRSEIENRIYQQMMREADLSKITTRITIPTLIIWRAKDQIFGVHNAKLFSDNIDNSQLVILKEIGHVAMIEDPETSATVFESFIKNKSDSRASQNSNI